LANQGYVDNVLRWYAAYAAEDTTIPAPTVTPTLPARGQPTATPKMLALLAGLLATLLGLGKFRGR
jgi:hypothetical protein